MAIYLVDYENVGIKGLTGIERLNNNDAVYIFYGKIAGAVPFEAHVKITNSKAAIKYIKGNKIAKNYLDFQLATYCGYLMSKLKEENYYIISKDTGFNAVVDFWHKHQNITGHKIKILIKPNIYEEIKQITTPEPTKKINTKEQLKKISAKEQAKSITTKEQAKKITTNEVKKVTTKKPAAQISTAEPLSKIASKPQAQLLSNKVESEKKVVPEEVKPKDKVLSNVTKEKKEPTKNGRKKTLAEKYRKEIRKNLKGKNIAAATYTMLYRYVLSSANKQVLHNTLLQKYPVEGKMYYEAILAAFIKYQQDEAGNKA